MGSSRWSSEVYAERAVLRAKSTTPVFAYDAANRDKATGQVKADATVHPSLSPMNVSMRESRDSEAHPTSHAVAVLLDQTGSMRENPRIIQQALPQLMGLLTGQGYLEHPAILIAGIGDAYHDQCPLQVGQFESGIEIENDLTNLILEGNGGVYGQESYELALWFAAEKFRIDCWEKRSQKGYLFVIGDELPYDDINVDQVRRHCGDRLQGSPRITTVVEKLKEQWDIHFLIPDKTRGDSRSDIVSRWRTLLGEGNVCLVPDTNSISQLIAGIIGIAEGKADVEAVRVAVEATSGGDAARAVQAAVEPYARIRRRLMLRGTAAR